MMTLKTVFSDYDLRIINVLGEVVMSKSIVSKTANIDLSDFNSGLYFVELSSENIGVITKNIVVE